VRNDALWRYWGTTERSGTKELSGVSTEVLRVVVVGGTFRGRPRSRIGITGVDWSFSRAGVRAEV
jgi:hypothetical protein